MRRATIGGATLAAAAMMAPPAMAQTAGPPDSPDAPPEVTVIGQRLGGNLGDIPRSITVIDKETLASQLPISRDIGDILGRLVPGIGASVEGRANGAGQANIRGRRLQLVVDGVVQNNTLLDSNQELGIISPDLIDRIEVIRGGTAIFGFGATGGIVNVTTKRPRSGPPQLNLRVSTTFQPDHFNDTLATLVSADALFSVGKFDFRLDGAVIGRANRFDADGRRIPTPTSGSIDNTRDYNFNGVVGFNISPTQRIEIQGLFQNREETDRWVAVGGSAITQTLPTAVHTGPGIQTTAVLARTADAPPVLFVTKQGQISYDNADLLGSKLNLIAYFQDKYNRTVTQLSTLTALPGVPSQSVLLRNYGDQKRAGSRLTVTTPLHPFGAGANVVWGVDYEWQKYIQPNNVPGLDPNTPPITQNSYAGFAQVLIHPFTDRLTINGGVRYESITASIDDFRVSRLQTVSSVGNLVKGGKLKFDHFIPNIGAVFEIARPVSLYGSFAQGFSIGELLRPIRATTAPSVAQTVDLKPLVVNNYELGVRGNYGPVSYSLAAFWSSSELGATFIPDPLTGNNTVERAPERIHGVEATLDIRVSKVLTLGGNIAYQEGKRQVNGVWVPLPGNRINPLKIYDYIELRPTRHLRLRFDTDYGGPRNAFPGSTNANEGRVRPLFLANAAITADVGPGQFSLGVQNLFNREYVLQFIQAQNSTDYYSGQGRVFTLGYQVKL